MSPPEVIVHYDAGLLAKAVAARLVTKLVDVQAATGRTSLVLTGGGIGTAVLTELAAAPARDAVDWRHLDIWWGDERFLPSGDPERNEAGAQQALLCHLDMDPSGPSVPGIRCTRPGCLSRWHSRACSAPASLRSG